MRISDWSSDVCSSDLCRARLRDGAAFRVVGFEHRLERAQRLFARFFVVAADRPRFRYVGYRRDHHAVIAARESQCVAQHTGAPWEKGSSFRASREGTTGAARPVEIGRANVRNPVTNAQLVCRLLLEKTKPW